MALARYIREKHCSGEKVGQDAHVPNFSTRHPRGERIPGEGGKTLKNKASQAEVLATPRVRYLSCDKWQSACSRMLSKGLLALLALGGCLGRSLAGGLGFGALGWFGLTLGARLSHGSDLPLTFFPAVRRPTTAASSPVLHGWGGC